ncbi:MAG: DUF3470 domain-containing protein, partial [Cyclobacteriaceae bacterium]|nr:DUF3470 domain-containing protein [Cyclobacteriaceae bacterium]
AILPDTDAKAEPWLEMNKRYANEWPNITAKKDPMPEADEMKDKANKYEDHFSAESGDGD